MWIARITRIPNDIWTKQRYEKANQLENSKEEKEESTSRTVEELNVFYNKKLPIILGMVGELKEITPIVDKKNEHQEESVKNRRNE